MSPDGTGHDISNRNAQEGAANLNPPVAPGIDVVGLRVAAVLNTASGSCGPDAPQDVEDIFRKAKISPLEIASVGADQIEPTLSRLVASKIELLVVVGGDGTIRSAAERCIGNDVILMPLPGGTMNMLPKALYGERTWQSALTETLADPMIRPVSGGAVGEHRFFCAGIFGAPALWADAREAAREAKYLAALHSAIAAYRRAFEGQLRYTFGGTSSGRAEAVAVICPSISTVLPDEAPVLEAVALDPSGAAQAFQLAISAMFSDWRKDPNVSTARVKTVTVSSQSRVPGILDGETVRLPRKFNVTFEPHCFDALIPVDHPG